MTIVRMLTALAGPTVSIAPGDFVEVDPEIAKAWKAAGCAEEASKRDIGSASLIEYKPAPPVMRPPPGLRDPLTLPDGKARPLADVVASVAKRNELEMAAWNNLGDGQKRELINREIVEMKRKLAAGAAKAEGAAAAAELVDDSV